MEINLQSHVELQKQKKDVDLDSKQQSKSTHANDDDYKGGKMGGGGAIIHYNECGMVK